MYRRYPWLLALLLIPFPLLAQFSNPTRAGLSGHVREEGSGHVIVSARVDLLNAMGSPIESVFTDGNGVYEFSEIPGDCYVAVQHDGYMSAREFIRPGGAPHVYKDVFLRPQSSSTPSAGNPVSQHQLSVPPKAREFFDKGVQLVVDKQDYHAAIAQFSKAIQKYPDYYEAYAAMGLAQSKVGNAADAEVSLRRSIELSNEKYPQAMIDLGEVLNASSRFSEAEPLLRKVVALDASAWRGHYELAVALAGEKRFTDAVGSATAARDVKPDNPQLYLYLYSLHVQADDFSAALADLDGYLKLSPNGAMADRARKMREKIQKEMPGVAAPATPASPHSPTP